MDFGRGPTIKDAFTEQTIATWIFVRMLAWSRHQYAEIVPDQKVETWLSCHRSAFEFFGGVPARVVIDNPKKCHHQGVLPRSGGAARLRRVRLPASPCLPDRQVGQAGRRLWLHDLTVSRARPEEKGARGGCREGCQTQFCAPAPLP